MLNIQKQQAGKESAILKLEGDVTVEQVGALQQALLEGLTEQDQLLIDCDQVTGMDFYAIQLLCSAHRTSISWNKKLAWHGDMPAVVNDAIKKAGFARSHGCDLCPDHARCMWI